MKKYCLTTVGGDKPGIVSSVSKVLFDHHCNIEESSMANLGGEFAIILILSTSEKTDTDNLKQSLDELKKANSLMVNLNELTGIINETKEPAQSNYTVHVYGSDKPGIVYKTCDILADNKINIIDLSTKVIRSEIETVEVYLMLIEVDIPKDVVIENVNSELKELADELGVDVELHEVEVYSEL